jgi:hypothetical protein
LFSSKLFSQNSDYTDTLWLHNKFILNKTNYENKKLSILFDSLSRKKVFIKDYSSPMLNEFSKGDTLKVLNITLYFNGGFLPVVGEHAESFFEHSLRTDTLNTHVPFIKIKFKKRENFMHYWYDADRHGLGSIRWNAKLRSFWGRFVVDKIEVGEY